MHEAGTVASSGAKPPARHPMQERGRNVMGETWTIKRCLDWTRDYLKDKGRDRARLSAEWMLSSVTGMSRVELYMNHDRPLSQDELDIMHDFVVRRMKGEPLQYITGDTQFRTLTIACAPGVLIPRPETEMLVEEALSYLDAEVLGAEDARPRAELPWNAQVEEARREEEAAREVSAERAAQVVAAPVDFGGGAGIDDAQAAEVSAASALPAPEADSQPPQEAPRQARVLEIGCGTGCISLSLAAERPGRATCIATDVEPRAVALAMRNRDNLGIAADAAVFRQGDLVDPIQDEERGTFDLLISNPPYIPTAVMARLPEEVSRYEPRLALESGVDGLDLFRRIVDAAPGMLRPGGLLACELYEGSLNAAANLCLSAGFADVRVVNDLTGRPRIILARRP